MFKAFGDLGAREARREPRMKVLLIGSLKSERGIAACRILDISRGGACLETDWAHRSGESVTFERGGFKVAGTIMWARGHRLGVCFDAPIRATDLLVQMSYSRQVQASAVSQAKPVPVSAAANVPFPSR